MAASLAEQLLGPLPSPAAVALAADLLHELARDGVIFIRRDAMLFVRRRCVVAVVDRTDRQLDDLRQLHAAWMAVARGETPPGDA